MANKIIYSLFFLVTAFNLSAQHTNADSLKQIIAGTSVNSEKIKASISLVKLLTYSDLEEVKSIADKGIELAKSDKDSVSLGVLINGKGVAYYFKGKYDSAAQQYFLAINILEKQKAFVQLAAAYNDVGRLFRKTRDLDKALFYYDKSMSIYKNLNDEEGIATIYNESGVVFEYMGSYDEAIRRYTASLQIQQKRNDENGIGYCYNFLAGVYVLKKDFVLAEKYNLLALKIREKLKDSFAIALSYSDLGAMYIQQKSFKKASEAFNKSNDFARRTGYIELQSANLKELSQVAKQEGNFQLAYEYYQQFVALKDSIFSIEKTKQIEDISARYETAKKEQQIQQQQFEITKRNYWIAGIVLLLLLGSWLAYSIHRRNKLKQLAVLQEEILKQQELATKAILEAEENERKRIAGDLHDGVGQMMSAAKMNLSSMETEIPFANESQRKVYEKVLNLVDESCKEVRSVSHNMMPNALLKNGLANAVREFVNQIDSRVIKIDLYAEGLNEKLDSNVETVLYRVIQECVNNVIKHAGANHLDISLIKDADGISATIEDNGKGFDIEEAKRKGGIGFKNMQLRTEYLKGTVEWSSSSTSGTLVAIHVPLSL